MAPKVYNAVQNVCYQKIRQKFVKERPDLGKHK
jgi:hypothetical protein